MENMKHVLLELQIILIFDRKKPFHIKSFYFSIIADFEAHNEIEFSSIVDKTTNFYEHNPVCNGYHIISELEDVSKSGCYSSNFDDDFVDWFAKEVTK